MKKILSLILVLGLTCSQAFAANEWRAGTGELTVLGTSNPSDLDTNIYQKIVAPLDRVLANYRQGCTISYVSATTVSVAAGEVVCSKSDGSIRKFRQNTSATTVTFANIDTGAEEASKTYYVHAVADADANTFTVVVSLSDTAPTGVTYFKKLGSFYNDASSNISGIKNDNQSQYGVKVSKSVNVVYQATTDGLVTAWADAAGSGGNLIGYTDSSTTPTTVVTKTGDSPHDATSHQMSIAFQVRSGDYYEVTASAWTPTIYFNPKE